LKPLEAILFYLALACVVAIPAMMIAATFWK
jgi:hypothetical protein